QERTGEVYAGLAAADWGGRWLTLGPDTRAADVAARLTLP
ncbi:MAG TPA: dTMP kinase, partial [Mycobacterium sp.]